MVGFAKLATVVTAVLVLCAVSRRAMADAVLVPLDGSNKTVKPSDFGYDIDVSSTNRRAIIQIVLTKEAAKSFGHGSLKLTKSDETIVETTLGLDYAGDEKGLLKITLDDRAIDGGELIIWSGLIQGQPFLRNFGGFRLSIKTLLDQAHEASGKQRSSTWP
jgi:hypothetical protein